ncbi:MAG: hypothetical protein AB4372_36520 [Xenococcus sp. (in: cyanobacteria)]
MPEKKGIWIITTEPASEELISDRKSGRGGYSYDDPVEDAAKVRQQHRQENWVTAEDLKGNMNQFLEVLEETFDQAEQTSSQMQLSEVELTVEINGKGQVGLLGTGGEVGGKGAIKLKFTRNNG